MIKDLFIVKPPKKKFNANKIKFEGSYPYVARGASNNGIRGYVNLDKSYLNEANSLSFGQDTATIYYQTDAYFTGDKIKIVLLRQNELDRLTACYLIAAIRKSFSSFSWGTTSFSEEIINSVKIHLPVNTDSQPDYEFMRERMHELELECLSELELEHKRKLKYYFSAAEITDSILSAEERAAINQMKNLDFQVTRIGGENGIFDIATGRDIIIGKTSRGNVPLISHQHRNNGISKRIARIPDKRIFDYNKTLSLADRGVFLATTQCEDFHIGTRVKALTFKDGEKSENIRLFFVAAINKLQIMFTEYLNNATDSLPFLTIQLPSKNDEIDYEYMDTFIRAIKKECIAFVKAEMQRELEAYRKVIN